MHKTLSWTNSGPELGTERSDLKAGMEVFNCIWLKRTLDKVTRKEVVSILYVRVDLTESSSSMTRQ